MPARALREIQQPPAAAADVAEAGRRGNVPAEEREARVDCGRPAIGVVAGVARSAMIVLDLERLGQVEIHECAGRTTVIAIAPVIAERVAES